MDAKLNQSDLISLLAKGCNISVAKAELFTKNFFDLIVEGLEQDGIVKINGLGTFKITDVASRGSVNVNTGEKIEIKGHKKLTFIPADALKDNVNQPFAMFEPVEVDDTYQPESANESEADETVEVDGVTEVVIEDVPTITEQQEETSEFDGMEPSVEEKEPFVAGGDAEEKTEKEDCKVEMPTADKENVESAEPKNEPVVVQERPSEPIVVPVPQKNTQAEKQATPVKKKKAKSNFFIYSILGFIIGFAIVFMLRRNNSSDVDVQTADVDNAQQPTALAEVKTQQTTIIEAETVATTTDSVANIAAEPVTENIDHAGKTENSVADISTEEEASGVYVFTVVEELKAIPLKDITLADTLLYVANGEYCSHIVAPNETLTKISKKYFFDKKLWPYIVKYNNMDKPDALRSGMEIRIPCLIPRKTLKK